MRTGLKIILIIGLFMFMAALIAIMNDATGHGSSRSAGPFGTILTFIFVAAIVAIWKYKPEKQNENKDIEKRDDNDKHQLDKR
jgi:uncharacterized membrane protein